MTARKLIKTLRRAVPQDCFKILRANERKMRQALRITRRRGK